MKSKTFLFAILITILVLSGLCFYFLKDKNVNTPETIKNNEKPEQILSSIEWIDYSSAGLGFSMKFPEEVLGLYKCASPQKFTVPLKTFEDNQNGVVYLAPEYYYQADWNNVLQQFTGECKKIAYSVESLKSEISKIDPSFPSLGLKLNKPWLGWAVIMKTVTNENELAATIKEMLGSGCVYNKESWQQTGVYDIKIGEKDTAGSVTPENTTCPVWHYGYKALYYPDRNRLFFIKLGQECTFNNEYDEPNLYQCYDQEIIDSFRLQ